MDFLEKIFVPIVTALIGAGGWKWFAEWQEKRKGKKVERTFESTADIYDILQSLKDEVHADRVNVIKYHNGGGIPRTGAAVYKSILYEACRDGLDPIRGDIQNYQLDEEHARQIKEIILTGSFYLPDNSNMPKGEAKGMNERLGIVSSFKAKILSTDKAVFIIQVVFSAANSLTEAQSAAIKMKANRLKQLLE